MNDEHTMTKDDTLDGWGWLGIRSSLTAQDKNYISSYTNVPSF